MRLWLQAVGLAFALAATLAGCQSRPASSAAPLAANTLACRDPSTIPALAAAGNGFQRAADDQLASGRCRIFPSGHLVRDRQPGRFADAATGTLYWIYGQH